MIFQQPACAEEKSSVEQTSKQETSQETNDLVQQIAQMLQDPEFAAHMQQSMHESFGSLSDQKTVSKGHASMHWGTLNFYKDYLQKYYPKVFVIRELFFENMEPEQIALALGDIVALFTQEPWFYFVDKKKQCDLAFYWEYILDQVSFISEFLNIARVDLKTKSVFMPEQEEIGFSFGFLFAEQGFSGHAHGMTKNLFEYLKEQGVEVVFDFYALCFDYVIKLFNENILLKNTRKVERCFSDLKFILKKLDQSVYEKDYQDVLKTCKELMDKLKTKLGEDDMSFIESFFQDDDEARKMAKESIELGYL
ncbi:MAG: hypothetical protein V1855_02870 [bacterium]